MGLISRVSSRTTDTRNGAANSVPPPIGMEHHLQPAQNQQNARRKIGFLYTGKRGTVAKCGDTGKPLQGVKAARPAGLQPGRTTRRAKTVNRAYGGCIGANALKRRITRAFLIEEQKIVVKVMKAQKEAALKAQKEQETKGKKKSKKSKK